jgi:hypothetical protein
VQHTERLLGNTQPTSADIAQRGCPHHLEACFAWAVLWIAKNRVSLARVLAFSEVMGCDIAGLLQALGAWLCAGLQYNFCY